MRENTLASVREAVAALYRAESRRVLATLIRRLGDSEERRNANKEMKR